MRSIQQWAAWLAVAALGGCVGPAHLGPGTTGQATRAVASCQVARPPSERIPAAVTGLDSQEAAIVSGSYLRSLAPRGAAVEEPSVLYVAPPAPQSQSRALPPPSVPSPGR